jgi:hypothetical protein
MRVYAMDWGDDTDGAPLLLVERDQGPLLVLDGDRVDQCMVLSPYAVELVDPDTAAERVLDRVRDALAAVKMSKTARDAVSRALDGLGEAS